MPLCEALEYKALWQHKLFTNYSRLPVSAQSLQWLRKGTVATPAASSFGEFDYSNCARMHLDCYLL